MGQELEKTSITPLSLAAEEKATGISLHPSMTELEALLLRHARASSSLADLASNLEGQWLEFANAAEASHLPIALRIISKADRLRRGMIDECLRIAELVSELDRPRVSITVRESAVLLAPHDPRGRETE
jgi:hypothetical protein